jgi:hypothetical protein
MHRFLLQALSPPADPYTLPSPTGQLPRNITLYQYEVCPFCCKVKAFLDYHKVRRGRHLRRTHT